jgi:DNA repair ATPase RecN
MEKSNIKKRIKELENKREEYRFIAVKLSDVDLSDSERKKYINDNKSKIAELNQITKEIADLKWNLMSPEQQKDYLDKYSED